MLRIKNFNEVFQFTQYPAGEPHIELKSSPLVGMHDLPDIIVYDTVRDFNGIGLLLTANDILNAYGAKVQWVVPYFPFARHDRRNHGDDGFELMIAMSMLRGSGIEMATVDPHSEVSGMITHFSQADVVDELINAGAFDNHPVIIIPDAGATKKTYSWVNRVHSRAGYTPEVVQCLKKRDPLTGKLSGFKVISDELEGKNVIIVDDICDGGGTFIGLAEELVELGVEDLTLAVTHGLFTKGIQPLFEWFHNIYTLDCYQPDSVKCADEVEFISLYNIIERAMPV